MMKSISNDDGTRDLDMGAGHLYLGLERGVEGHRPDKSKFPIELVCIRI